MENSASAVGGAADTAPTPISRAHAYAAAAEEFAEQHDRPRAIDAHFRAAEQFMLAVNFASDPEAIRTLKLLYANHTRQGKELQRRVAVSTSRGVTAGKEKLQTMGTSQRTPGQSGQLDGPPTPEEQTPPPPSSAPTGYRQLRPSAQPAGSPAQYVPPDSTTDGPRHSPTSLATVASRAPGTPAQPDDSRPLGHPPFARHRHSGSPSSDASSSLGRTTHIPQNQPSFPAVHGSRASPRQTDGRLQLYPAAGLRGELVAEFGSYSTHGLPNTGHAILPVQSLDASVVHASQANAKSQPIDESYMVLKDKDDDADDSDPFNKFWEVVEGLMQKISNPVAFATAPLGGQNGLGDNQAAVQSYPDHTFLPVRHIPHPFTSSYVSVRGGVDVNPPNSTPLDMAEVHAPGRPAQDLSHTGHGSGQLASVRRDVAESAYFIVPGRDGILTPNRRYGSAHGSGSPDLNRHFIGGSAGERLRPGAGSSSSQLGPGLVNTSQVISPRGLPRSGSKTLEEYAIENHQLKMTVDFLSQRVASLERAAEENTMLKSSLCQFRQEVSRHAKRIMQSQEIMRSSALSSARPSRADNSASNAQVSRLQSKLQELEEELKVAKQEAEKHSLMSAKYRGKWEKLKEAARKKRHNVGEPPGGPLLGSSGGGEEPSPALSSDAPPDPSRENRSRGKSPSGDDAGAPADPGRVGPPLREEEGRPDPGEDDPPGEAQPLEGLRGEDTIGHEGQVGARTHGALGGETTSS